MLETFGWQYSWVFWSAFAIAIAGCDPEAVQPRPWDIDPKGLDASVDVAADVAPDGSPRDLSDGGDAGPTQQWRRY
jgi:hypothetical protein